MYGYQIRNPFECRIRKIIFEIIFVKMPAAKTYLRFGYFSLGIMPFFPNADEIYIFSIFSNELRFMIVKYMRQNCQGRQR